MRRCQRIFAGKTCPWQCRPSAERAALSQWLNSGQSGESRQGENRQLLSELAKTWLQNDIFFV